MTKPNRQLADGDRQLQSLRNFQSFVDLPLCWVVVGAGFGAQFGTSHTLLGPVEAATNCGSLSSSKQVAQGQSQAAADTDQESSYRI